MFGHHVTDRNKLVDYAAGHVGCVLIVYWCLVLLLNLILSLLEFYLMPKDFLFIMTHQFIPSSVHFDAPLDGVVKLLVTDELLVDGCRIVSPGSRFNQALEWGTCVLLIGTAVTLSMSAGAKNKPVVRVAEKQLTQTLNNTSRWRQVHKILLYVVTCSFSCFIRF